jgi:DNA-directed RNA polymerase subunit M/transcription elongation factor TFIIS
MICPECHSILIEQEYWDEKFYECVNCNYLVNVETGEKDAKIF